MNILTITEEELVELRGKRGEEAAEGGYEPAHHSRDSRGLAHAQRHRHRRQRKRHSRRQSTQTSWKT